VTNSICRTIWSVRRRASRPVYFRRHDSDCVWVNSFDSDRFLGRKWAVARVSVIDSDRSTPGVTNLFAIAGHFVSYRWVSGPHNFLAILWNLLKTKKIVLQQKQTTNESNNCWSRLNVSRAARNSFVGRMFVTPVRRIYSIGASAQQFVELFYLLLNLVKTLFVYCVTCCNIIEKTFGGTELEDGVK